MRPLLSIALLLACSTLGSARTCNTSLWKHVYHGPRFANASARLKPLKNCITVTGKIESASPERDGDYHIRLGLDPQFKKLLNAKNMTGQKGFLVVEPMCVRRVK